MPGCPATSPCRARYAAAASVETSSTLHDAILAHDHEAKRSRRIYDRLRSADQLALVAFLEDL